MRRRRTRKISSGSAEQFRGYSLDELREQLRTFSQTVNTGGSMSGSKTDAALLRELLAEIERRELEELSEIEKIGEPPERREEIAIPMKILGGEHVSREVKLDLDRGEIRVTDTYQEKRNEPA